LPALRIPSLEIFRHRQFTRFMLARWAATFAVQMQLAAMMWQVYDVAREQGQTIAEGAFVLGLVGLAQFLPLLALSLFGGQAADRYNRKLIVGVCLAVKAMIALGLVFASQMSHDIIIPAVFGAAIAAGATNAFLPPASTALLPMLLPREDLPQGIAWSSLAFNSSLIVGPMIGMNLYAVSPMAAYGGAFALLLIGVALVVLLKAPPQEPPKEARTVGMIADGLRYVWNNKIVLGAISLDLVVVLLAGAVALLPVFARDLLHVDEQGMGILRSAMGVGAAVVALWLAVKPLRRRVGYWMFGSTILFGLATIVFARSTDLWLTATALAFAGGVDMISVYVRQSLIQLATPDAMRGRVAAVSFVFISASNELGDFEAGLMARIFGPVLAVTIGGVAAVAASTGWMKLFPELAKADGFEPGALPPEAQSAVSVAQEVEKA
jgi:MFS family permease